jgi:diacylglycerol kinase (ATP)
MNDRPERVKLIFNPNSGAARQSPSQLLNLIAELQNDNFLPEVYLLQEGGNLEAAIKDSLDRGLRLFVVCGGDGTIESVAAALSGTDAVLGIVPAGTYNNVALSLGIPEDIPAAAALLRDGQMIKVDMGIASCGEFQSPFLEICSVGLLSAIFPALDDIQHGDLTRIGDFLATLVNSSPAEISLVLDNRKELNFQGHVVLVANMPYVGPHYQIGVPGSFVDGLLDVLVFANLNKLEILDNAVQTAVGGAGDPRIQRYQVREISIDSSPPMPVLVDGRSLGTGKVQIRLREQALQVIANQDVAGLRAPKLEQSSSDSPNE